MRAGLCAANDWNLLSGSNIEPLLVAKGVGLGQYVVTEGVKELVTHLGMKLPQNDVEFRSERVPTTHTSIMARPCRVVR